MVILAIKSAGAVELVWIFERAVQELLLLKPIDEIDWEETY